ncbi:MAG: sigma-70 family RNA polymerase sigma factor [Candidatus Hydrogenedentota bacterium]|nr:MAG: sigma-70 family RNA polymerase sigma factor [Candidatus Hydrogenedentota bacterium]
MSLSDDLTESIDEHADYLFRYAVMRVRDPDVARDLVQETFLAALEKKASFSGKSSLRTWLTGILNHKVIDYFRGQKRESVGREENTTEKILDEVFDEQGGWRKAPSPWTKSPEELIETTEFRRVFLECLERLPDNLFSVYTLREADGLETEEICKELQITPTNLWVMLHRARGQLRRCLERNWFEKDR